MNESRPRKRYEQKAASTLSQCSYIHVKIDAARHSIDHLLSTVASFSLTQSSTVNAMHTYPVRCPCSTLIHNVFNSTRLKKGKKTEQSSEGEAAARGGGEKTARGR